MNKLFAIFLVLTGSILVGYADGGAVIASDVVGPHRVTVFADPAVLRAGPVDFSVLVQDARTDEPVRGARIAFKLTKLKSADSPAPTKAWLSPCTVIPPSNRDLIPATHEAAQNKLLQAATVILPTTGNYELVTQVGDATIPVHLTALAPASPLATFWPVLALPGVAIGLFALRERIRR
jgi:hypothetical protein